ncbi:MAG: AI-2E family transporter [Ruminococcus sp.]|nr:AI-2E family transporter [Ruminococcus sp.]
MEKKDFKKWVSLIVIAALAFCIANNYIILVNFINKVIHIFFPFILGGAIAFVLNIPMTKIENWLKKFTKTNEKKSSLRILAIILSLIIFILVIAFILFLLLPELVENIESLIQNIPDLLDNFRNFILDLLNKYPDVQYKLNELFASNNITSITTDILNYIANSLIGLISGIVSGFITIFTALIFSVYILSQKEYLKNGTKKLLKAYLKKDKASKVEEIIKLTSKTFSSFISGQCLEAIILGLLLFISLIIFKFPYALLISVLTSITALIPIFGALIAMLIGAILIAIESPFQALMFIIVFQIIQQIEGNFIYPRVVGKSVGLPPMWTLLAISVGGSTFGIMGMLVGLPIVSIVYTLIRTDVNKRVKR